MTIKSEDDLKSDNWEADWEAELTAVLAHIDASFEIPVFDAVFLKSFDFGADIDPLFIL